MRKPDRPTSVTVIAVLLLVFGVLGLCGSGYALAVTLSGSSNLVAPPGAGGKTSSGGGPPDIQAEMEKQIPNYKAIKTVQLSVSTLVLLLQLLAAVGLLNLQGWGRKLALAWAVLHILEALVNIVYGLLVEMPAMNNVLAQLSSSGGPAGPIAAQAGQVSLVVGYAFSLLFLIFPVLVLVYLNKPHVKRAFAGLMPDRDEPEDYHDRRPPGRREDFGEDDRGYDEPRRGDDRIRE
jgi:hypothetical protein